MCTASEPTGLRSLRLTSMSVETAEQQVIEVRIKILKIFGCCRGALIHVGDIVRGRTRVDCRCDIVRGKDDGYHRAVQVGVRSRFTS